MKQLIFFLLLFWGEIIFSQTLTPEICWSFDGKNTDLKEIVLTKVEEADFFTNKGITIPIRFAEGAVPQPLALIDDNVRWIVVPAELSENLSYEKREKEKAIMMGKLFFALSLHVLERKTPFNMPSEILQTDRHIMQMMATWTEGQGLYNFREIEIILLAYHSLSDTLISHYPPKIERIGTFMLSYMNVIDSLGKIKGSNEYSYTATEEKRMADSLAAAYMQDMAIADSIAAAVAEAQLYATKTKVKWSSDSYNFGEIKDGTKIGHSFSVKNVGKNDLYLSIKESELSPAFSLAYCENEPIKPSKSCEITVIFDSYEWDRTGYFTAEIPVHGNFGENKIKYLTLTGNVIGSSPPNYTYNEPDFTPPIDKAQAVADSLPKTQVQWVEETYDFKKIQEGEKPVHSFEVKNIGKEDLHITKVKPSCGCTATYCTQEVIKPGESCQVVVEFNSAGKSGTQQKSITVTGNFEGGTQKVLKFTGEVVNKAGEKE